MLIANVIQGSDSWLTWRSEGITATDIPIIMGLSPYKTPYQLWQEKTGRLTPPDLSNNPNVQRGHRLEDEARQLAEETHNEVLLPICGICEANPILRASLDGLSEDGIPYEFKAPSQKIFEELTELGTSSPTYRLYEMQVKAQCTVAQANHAVLLFYREDGDTLEFDVTCTQHEREYILEAAERFWDAVQSDTAPPLDADRDVYLADLSDESVRQSDAWLRINSEIKAMEAQIKTLKASQKMIVESLLSDMGDFCHGQFGRVKVTTFTKRGTIDYPKLMAEKGISDAEMDRYRKDDRIETRITELKRLD